MTGVGGLSHGVYCSSCSVSKIWSVKSGDRERYICHLQPSNILPNSCISDSVLLPARLPCRLENFFIRSQTDRYRSMGLAKFVLATKDRNIRVRPANVAVRPKQAAQAFGVIRLLTLAGESVDSAIDCLAIRSFRHST